MAPSLKYTKEQMNYFMLFYVINNEVTEGLWKIFKQEWDSRYKTTLGKWKDTPDNGENLYTIIHCKSTERNHYFWKIIRKGNRAEWDCSKLCYVILNCDSPDNFDCSITSNVNRLRNLRKKRTVDFENPLFAFGQSEKR